MVQSLIVYSVLCSDIMWLNLHFFCVLHFQVDLYRVDLITWVEKCTSMHASVRPSVHKKFRWFQWKLIRRSRSTSDAWWYAVWPDPRSRSQALESRKFGYFQRLSPPPFIMGAGKWPWILKLGHNT